MDNPFVLSAVSGRKSLRIGTQLLLIVFLLENVNSSPMFSSPQSSFEEDLITSDCQCTPRYLCRSGSRVTDGSGIIQLRALEDSCRNPSEVCCKVPERAEKRTEKEQSCGRRKQKDSSIFDPEDDYRSYLGEFPWMVAVVHKDKNGRTSFQCGGALIHRQAVLTVGHCVKKFETKLSELYVIVGTTNIGPKSKDNDYQEILVPRLSIHEEFNMRNSFNNIAVLFLRDPVKLNEGVNTVCLPNNDYTETDADNNIDCFTAGWGKEESGKYSNTLHKIRVPIVPRSSCQSKLRKTVLGSAFVLHESFVCAGGLENNDACEGDGGGPLVCPMKNMPDKYLLTGLVAWGIGCRQEDVPGVYVNVPFFRHWIDDQLQSIQPSYFE